MAALTNTREHEEVADENNFPISPDLLTDNQMIEQNDIVEEDKSDDDEVVFPIPPVQLTNNQFVEENNILGRNNNQVVYYTSHDQLTNSQFIERNNFAREFDFSNNLTCSTFPSLLRFISIVGLILPKKVGSPDDGMYKKYVQPVMNIYHTINPSSNLFTRGYNFLNFFYMRRKDPIEKK